MVDTLVVFLDANFAGGDQRVLDARSWHADLAEYRIKAVDAHVRQIDALTRLRLLAPKPWSQQRSSCMRLITACARRHSTRVARRRRATGLRFAKVRAMPDRPC
ncbi:MAG: hypothetical protein QOG10_5567 [Kribbellaceae bacterium]|nr:hypothetical protein [Kribbellaceae bacterium]